MKKLVQYLLIAVVFGFSTYFTTKATESPTIRTVSVPVFKEMSNPQKGYDVSVRIDTKDVQIKETDNGLNVNIESPVEKPKTIVKKVVVKDTVFVNEYPMIYLQPIKAKPFCVEVPSVNI